MNMVLAKVGRGLPVIEVAPIPCISIYHVSQFAVVGLYLETRKYAKWMQETYIMRVAVIVCVCRVQRRIRSDTTSIRRELGACYERVSFE